MRTIGQVVGRNLAELREARGQTQREAAAFVRGFGLAWTPANIASIESGRRETIDIGAFSVLALAYDVPPSRFFEGKGEVRLGAEVSAELEYYRGWLDRQVPKPPLTMTGRTARKVLDAMPDDGKIQFQADAELADRLGLEPKDVYRPAMELWGGRTLHEERDRRLAELGQMTPTQRRTRRGHITRQLAKELEPHLPKRDRSEEK
nr:hypothetical protein GCM10010200_029140 [Actinomadura rugatobispora]